MSHRITAVEKVQDTFAFQVYCLSLFKASGRLWHRHFRFPAKMEDGARETLRAQVFLDVRPRMRFSDKSWKRSVQ